MESQTTEAYRALFLCVRRLAPNMLPEYIMSDFETAQLNAFAEVFPLSRLTGQLMNA